MKFIPHFSVHCANIRVFCETTKFLEVFLIRELISRSLGVFFRKSPRPSFFDKASCTRQFESSFHCTHLHRFFPLKRAPPLTPTLFNCLYDPFGSPCRGQKPQERGRKPPYAVLYMPHLSLPWWRVLTLYQSPKSLP